MINRKKVTGILTELQAESDRIHSVIIGIGMNVNQQKSDFPEELQETATSLLIEGGEKVSRARVIQEVLVRLEALYEQFLAEGFLPIKQLWESYAISLGQEIKATTVNYTIIGKAIRDNRGRVYYYSRIIVVRFTLSIQQTYIFELPITPLNGCFTLLEYINYCRKCEEIE